MLFVQHFSVIWFCILHFLPGSILLVKIRSIGAVWGCFGVWSSVFCFVFCWTVFGVCMCMYACGYVCIQWRANWKTVLFILLLPPVEIKQIFTFVTFYFFLIRQRINGKWVSWISDLRRFYPWKCGQFAWLTYLSYISLGLKCLEIFCHQLHVGIVDSISLVWLP